MKTSRSWCSERLIGIFENTSLNQYAEEGLDLLKRRRVLDFTLAPGVVSAKVQDEAPKPIKVELQLAQFSDAQWDAVFSQLVKQAFFLAKLLAAELPVEIEEIFHLAQVPLFPTDTSELKIKTDESNDQELNKYLAAVVYRLADHLDNDPFSIFLWRGRGKDETISTLRKIRKQLRPTLERENTSSRPPALSMDTSDLNLKNFWTMPSGYQELSYNIKADELPAAILKRLDPLPLGSTIGEELDLPLEDLYAQIARRAQAFGLGLK